MKIASTTVAVDAVVGSASMVAVGGTTTGVVATSVTAVVGVMSAPTLILAAGGVGTVALASALLGGNNVGTLATEVHDLIPFISGETPLGDLFDI